MGAAVAQNAAHRKGSREIGFRLDAILSRDPPRGGRAGHGQRGLMPEISRFFGIIVAMHYNDHAPPHFHARYGGDQAIIAIESLHVLGGRLSPRVMGLVVEWALQHQDELLEDWRLARASAPLRHIAPLE